MLSPWRDTSARPPACGSTWPSPGRVPWDSGAANPMAWGPWDAARTWGRAIRTLGIGQPNANLEARLDRTWSASFGGRAADALLYRQHRHQAGPSRRGDRAQRAHLGWWPRPCSASGRSGSSTMYSRRPSWLARVAGARFGVSRRARALGATRLSMSWAGDLRAPSRDATTQSLHTRQVHGLGVTLDTPWYKSASQAFSSMIDASTLLHPGAHGFGTPPR